MAMPLATTHDDSRLIPCRQCHAPAWAPCRDTGSRPQTGPSSAYTHHVRRLEYTWAAANPRRWTHAALRV
jgi:hypothetical protein